MSSSGLERKKKLESLKRNTKNQLVYRAANILSRDISDCIVNDMKTDWEYLRNRKETKEYESDKRQRNNNDY